MGRISDEIPDTEAHADNQMPMHRDSILYFLILRGGPHIHVGADLRVRPYPPVFTPQHG